MAKVVFDQPHAQGLMKAMEEFLQWVLPALSVHTRLVTAVDVGCGVGLLADVLQRNGLHVKAFDGRQENVQEAKSRFPAVSFETANVESPELSRLGQFDLVMCFGLLYHLENPFQAIRNLHALTKDVLLLQSVCTPDERPVLVLRDENHGEDQGLNYVALYPSESALVKMCYRAGFPFVYRSLRLPDHQEFRSSRKRSRVRSLLTASRKPLGLPEFVLAQESSNGPDPWSTAWDGIETLPGRAAKFVSKPWPDKVKSIRRYLSK